MREHKSITVMEIGRESGERGREYGRKRRERGREYERKRREKQASQSDSNSSRGGRWEGGIKGFPIHHGYRDVCSLHSCGP
eukprot:606178-Amorphochlora_amoeboformis.AAC.1